MKNKKLLAGIFLLGFFSLHLFSQKEATNKTREWSAGIDLVSLTRSTIDLTVGCRFKNWFGIRAQCGGTIFSRYDGLHNFHSNTSGAFLKAGPTFHIYLFKESDFSIITGPQVFAGMWAQKGVVDIENDFNMQEYNYNVKKSEAFVGFSFPAGISFFVNRIMIELGVNYNLFPQRKDVYARNGYLIPGAGTVRFHDHYNGKYVSNVYPFARMVFNLHLFVKEKYERL